MCNFVNFVHLFCDAIYTGIKFIHKWLNSSVVLSFFDIINDFVVDTSCMLWCTNSRYRILESEFWKGRILPVVPPPYSGMLWLPGAAFLSGAPSLLLFFFCSHAVCLHSPAAYNFTLCNFLHLSGFLSKEERGPKNGRTIKALDVGVAAEMWRGFHVLSAALLDLRLSAPLLHSAVFIVEVCHKPLPLQLWAQAWSFP